MDLPEVNILSLASGGGGLDLGVEAALAHLGFGSRHVAYVEIEAYACEVLVARMEEGALAPAPVCTDLRTFSGSPFAGLVDLVVGGYPCQPFSLAGSRRGADDPRHLWPQVARVVRECKPSAVFFENVSGHLSLGAHDVIRELQGMGYRVACGLFTAEEVGAPHKRERLFILGVADAERLDQQRSRVVGDVGSTATEEHCKAPQLEWDGDTADDRGGGVEHTDGAGPQGRCLRRGGRADERAAGASSGAVGDAKGGGCGERNVHTGSRGEGKGTAGAGRAGEALADDDGGRRGQGAEQSELRAGVVGESSRDPRCADARGLREVAPWPPGPESVAEWSEYLDTFGPSFEPALRRGSDGLAHRLDRLRLLGNGVVPIQATYAFLTLLEDLVAFCAGSGSGRHDVASESTPGVGVAPELE